MVERLGLVVGIAVAALTFGLWELFYSAIGWPSFWELTELGARAEILAFVGEAAAVAIAIGAFERRRWRPRLEQVRTQVEALLGYAATNTEEPVPK